MRRFLLILLFFHLLVLPLNAGGPWSFPWKKAAKASSTSTSLKGLSSWQISQVLKKRAAASFREAKQAQALLTSSRSLAFGEPSIRVLRAKDMPQSSVYLDKPFLTTREQTANYLVSQSNRLFVRELKRIKTVWEQIDAHLPQLQEAAAQTEQSPTPITWLAQQIPQQTSLLFIGEVHGYTEIRQATAMLLTKLRQLYPTREILLFTEFLPANFHLSKNFAPQTLSLPRYAPVWETALQHNIEVIGLEPPFILEDFCTALAITRKGRIKLISQWALLEGVRMRNEYWGKTLQKYRLQHPNALFVVYSGNGHNLYNYPFSLSSALTKEKTFVAALYPDKFLKFASVDGSLLAREPKPTPFTGPLEELTEQVEFPQPVLHFKDPSLSRTAGFDVRIKLPVNLEQYMLEHGI